MKVLSLCSCQKLYTIQTTYRPNVQEIDAEFLQSLKLLFAGVEVEITVKPIPDAERAETGNSDLPEKNVFKELELNTKGFKFDREEANC